MAVLSWEKWKLCFSFILHCHSCTYVFLVLLLLLFTILGCFNINKGTFGSVKLKEMKIMLYMLPRSFLLYICQFNLFDNLLLLLLLIVLGCFNFNIGTFGSVKLKEMKIILYMLPHCFFLYNAILTCSLIYYYCCYWLSLDASTLTQGPLGVLSWKKWPSLYNDDKT